MHWVAIQAVLFTTILLLPQGNDFTLSGFAAGSLWAASIAGGAILLRAIYDLRKSLAIAPTPRQNGTLQTHGIYGYIRHPMYVAVWLIFGSLALRSGNYWKISLFIGIVVFFLQKARYEESLLLAKYPGYKNYQKKVGAYFPMVESFKGRSNKRIINKEEL